MPRNVRLSREERAALLGDLGLDVRRHQNVQEAFDDAAVAFLGINRTDGRALDILDQHGRLTAGELARESGLSTGAVTTLLDRLERAGYVRRVRDDADRRRVLVELTDEARRRSAEVWAPLAADGADGLAGYSDAELVLIRDFLRASTDLLRAHLERVAALPRGGQAGAASDGSDESGSSLDSSR
jgi:DNA-binding MarR family transcriptional regulator